MGFKNQAGVGWKCRGAKKNKVEHRRTNPEILERELSGEFLGTGLGARSSDMNQRRWVCMSKVYGDES